MLLISMLCRIARLQRDDWVISVECEETEYCEFGIPSLHPRIGRESKAVVADPAEPADPEGGGGFAEWAMLTLHALRIELGKSYRVALDLLSEMPAVLDEIGLTRLPHSTTFRDWFAKIPTPTWRAFLDARVVEDLRGSWLTPF